MCFACVAPELLSLVKGAPAEVALELAALRLRLALGSAPALLDGLALVGDAGSQLGRSGGLGGRSVCRLTAILGILYFWFRPFNLIWIL